MKKIIISTFISISLLLILNSCARNLINWRSGDLSYHNRKYFTRIWISSLNAQKDTVFSSWCDWIVESPDWNATYQNEFSPDDIPGLQMIPILVYSIDYKALSTFNNKNKLDQLLQLDTSLCRYFVKNGNEFISIIECRYVINNGLEMRRLSGFPKGDEQIARDYLIKGKDVFFLNVYLVENGKSKKEFLVCKDGEDFITIGPASIVELLKDELEFFRNSLGKKVIL